MMSLYYSNRGGVSIIKWGQFFSEVTHWDREFVKGQKRAARKKLTPLYYTNTPPITIIK